MLAAATIISSPVLAGEKALSKEQDFERFLSWFGGEYDNHEQVWQQEVNEVPEDERHEHIHHIFLPVEAPGVGENTFFIRQYMNGDYETVYRQRLYNFKLDDESGKIRLQIFRFADEAKYRNTDQDPSIVKELTLEEVINMPGCDVYWSFKNGKYIGEMIENACFFYSERSGGNIYITDTLYLTDSYITIHDEGFNEDGVRIFGRDESHMNRKVRYFKGWAGIKRKVLDENWDGDEDEMAFFGGIRMHNEGQIVPLVTKEGVDTGYSIELVQLTYQNTKTPVLKLGLIDEEGETFTYIWSNPEAKRIGINLRWMQVGLTDENL